MTLSYDGKADVLYISFEALPPHTYAYVENESGDILKIDRVSRRVIGCTIPFFKERSKRGRIVIPEIGAVPFNEVADLLLSA
jgi:uncharacterized protein YuzE